MDEKKYLSFKNPNWHERRKQIKLARNQRQNKTLKQISANEALSGREFNYQSIEAPPAQRPAKKYCDITGYESKYTDSSTGLIYYDRTICNYIRLLSKPVVQQFLSIRKPPQLSDKTI